MTRLGLKDTSVCRLIWNRWPGSSARGRRPKRWAGKGNHDAPSVRKKDGTIYVNKTRAQLNDFTSLQAVATFSAVILL